MITSSKHILQACSIIAAMLLFCLHSHAYTEYWFEAYSHASPTGAGKVYSSQKYVNIDTIPNRLFKDSTSYLWSAQNRGEAATSSIHLYAKPSAGYVFKNWTHNGTEISKITHCAPNLTSAKQNWENPQIEHYYANFVPKGSVAVYSSNEGAGEVMIDNPENIIGDEVTLTAISSIFNGRFKGWIKGSVDFDNVDLDDLNYISKKEVLTFTITAENQGDYYAVFKSRENEMKEKGMYCVVRNKGTQHCIGLKGTKELTLAEKQRYFKNSIELVSYDVSHRLPATVINIRGDYNGVGGLTKAEYISQGFSSKNIKGTETSQAPRLINVVQYTTNSYLTYAEGSGFTGYWVDFNDNKSREELIGEVYHPWTGNTNNYSDRHQWEILPLTEEKMDEYYFGASPSAKTKKDGKYYTTMYTAFPYKCMDGVKAYIADRFAGLGRIHIKEIESGIVPAYTAVLLECNGTDAKENRLVPVVDDVSPIEDTNLLKGEIWLNDESGNPDNYRTRFDKETMRVLNDDQAAFLGKNNKDTANGDTLLTYIANNTCYIDLSNESQKSYNYTWTTEDDDSTLIGDANGDGAVDISDVLLTVDFILGKQVSIFFFKNADVNFDNGIDISDVLGIVDIILGK